MQLPVEQIGEIGLGYISLTRHGENFSLDRFRDWVQRSADTMELTKDEFLSFNANKSLDHIVEEIQQNGFTFNHFAERIANTARILRITQKEAVAFAGYVLRRLPQPTIDDALSHTNPESNA